MLSTIFIRLVAPALVGAFAMTPLLFLAHNNGYGSAMKEQRTLHKHWWQTEMLLWSSLSDAHEQTSRMADQFELVLNAGERAQKEYRIVLSEYRKQATEGRRAASEALDKLAQIEDDWTAQPVSPDVVCVRDDRTGCDTRAVNAEGNPDTSLREPSSDDGS